MPEDQRPKSGKYKFSNYFYNGLTYLGVFLSLLAFFAECLLFGIDLFSPYSSVYLGMITYIVLPPFLILGLILIPVGALRKRKRVKMGMEHDSPKAFYLDPSIPGHRNAILIFTVGTVVLVVMTAIGSYKAFHYTESVHFCGTVCHTVMEPQYTAYLQSPHARVKCVECHIGPGAGWYARSKLSGLRQVYKTVLNKYPHPIPSPINKLRPATETCEECHWPKKFYSSVEIRRRYFPTEENENKEWSIRMLVHVGGSSTQAQGIHTHMYLNNDIYYVAEDEDRQEITWVKSVNNQGQEEIYTTEDSPYKDKEPPPELVRKMDCVDCHNRPTHHFNPPYKLLNNALEEGTVDASLPEIKQKAMAALSAEYPSKDQALADIRESLTKYYQKELGEDYPQREAAVLRSINQVEDIYRAQFFPEMKVRWDTYPDNIGHLVFPGCFRCHDGEHVSGEGKAITRDCTVCHTIIEQGPPGTVERNTEGLEFRHPFDENDMWKEMSCFDCHTGN